MKPLWIKNANLLTFDANRPILLAQDVLLSDGRIEKIVPTGSVAFNDAELFEAEGKWLLPGFVNAHTHAYSALVRGFGKAAAALDFQQQLENLWWKLDKSLSLEDCYHSAVVLALDSIRHGTTTVIDHHASPGAVTGSLDQLAKAFGQTGLRACLCYELSDRDGQTVMQAGIEENLHMIHAVNEKKQDHLKALFGLHASFTIGEETMKRVLKASEGLNLGFHIHAAEAYSDQTETWKMCGKRVIRRLADWGILGERTIAAHGIHLDSDEIDLLAASHTMVVHNPQSNLNNAVGIADVMGLHRKGVLVGLGTDAMTANMLEELRVAMFAKHLKQNSPSCGFSEIVGLLVENNYRIVERIFGIKIGKIQEGYAADCILFDYDPPTPLNEMSWAGHLVFGFSQLPVDSTIVAGKVLMKNRQFCPEIDERAMMNAARQSATALWNRF